MELGAVEVRVGRFAAAAPSIRHLRRWCDGGRGDAGAQVASPRPGMPSTRFPVRITGVHADAVVSTGRRGEVRRKAPQRTVRHRGECRERVQTTARNAHGCLDGPEHVGARGAPLLLPVQLVGACVAALARPNLLSAVRVEKLCVNASTAACRDQHSELHTGSPSVAAGDAN